MEFITEVLADFIGEIASLQIYKLLGRFKKNPEGNKENKAI